MRAREGDCNIDSLRTSSHKFSSKCAATFHHTWSTHAAFKRENHAQTRIWQGYHMFLYKQHVFIIKKKIGRRQPPHIHHWALARTIKRDPPLEFGEEYYALTEMYNQQHAIYSNISIAHALTLPHGLRLKTTAYHYNTHKTISEESSSRTTIEEF